MSLFSYFCILMNNEPSGAEIRKHDKERLGASRSVKKMPDLESFFLGM